MLCISKVAKEEIQIQMEVQSGNHECGVKEALHAKLDHLPVETRDFITDLFVEQGVVALSLRDLCPSNVPFRHQFELNDSEPVYHSARRMAPKHNSVVQKEIEATLSAGIVTPASSAWSFPIVIATKKDGKPRFCVDYRALNREMRADRFPPTMIQEIFDELAGAVFFSTLDLFSGYWQIRLSEECKEQTTFVCRQGTFKFEVMPFGLMNAPSSFQRMMNSLLGHLKFVKVYLDVVVIFSKDMTKHMIHLRAVIELIAKHGLKVKISKCEFARTSVSSLGHIVDSKGVRVDPSKIQVILETSRPNSQTELCSFLGIAGYYKRFIRSFATVSAPLHALTSTKSSFTWTEEAESAFIALKEAMTQPPVLAFPDFSKPFVVEADASAVAVGAVLSQQQTDNRVHPIQFSSRTMTRAERGYSACEKEALAVIFALRKFRVYLLSSDPFTVYSDQQALKAAFSRIDIHGRLARWLDFLAEYDFEVRFWKGSSNPAADFLSRISHGEQGIEGMDEGDVISLVLGDNAINDMEPYLQAIARHLNWEDKSYLTK